MEDKFSYCGLVTSVLKNINRSKLNEEFSKFGKVKKIYVEPDRSHAKVYLDTVDAVKKACLRLNGLCNWEISLFQSDLHNKPPPKNNFARNNYQPSHNPSQSLNTEAKSSFGSKNSQSSQTPKQASITSKSNSEGNHYQPSNNLIQSSNTLNMESAIEYVDVNGKPLEIVEDDDGKLFVNLEDVKAAGFYVFEKSLFEQCELPKTMELRHFELFLLNQGKNYILNHKKGFNEGEILDILQRVEEALIGKHSTAASNQRVSNSLIGNFPATNQNNSGSFDWDNRKGSLERGPDSNFRNDNRRDSDRTGPNGNLSHNRPPRNHNQNRKPFGNQRRGTNQRFKQFANQAAGTTITEETWEGHAEVKGRKVPRTESDNIDSRSTSSSSSFHLPITVDRVQLAQGSTYKVKVSYFNKKHPTKFYGQLIDNENIIMDLLCSLNSEDCDPGDLTETVRNTLCSVPFEDIWYRGVILHPTKTGVSKVELLDYGNREEVNTAHLKQLPEDMKQIPAQAIRFALAKTETSFNTDDILEVFVKKQYEDSTNVVHVIKVLKEEEIDEKPADPPAEPQAPTVEFEKTPVVTEEVYFTEIPALNIELQVGESVMIVNAVDNKLVLRNKQTAAICKQVYAHLPTIRKSPIKNPKVGQLVLCCRDSIDGLHRGVIKEITDKTAKVQFIDYHDEETLALQALRNVDETLASLSSTVILLDYPSLKNISPEEEALLNSLILEKRKLKVEQIKGKMKLMLTDEKGAQVPLFEANNGEKKPTEKAPQATVNAATPATIVTLQTPSKSETKEAPPKPSISEAASNTSPSANIQEHGFVSFDDMGFVQLEMGINDYVCYSCTGESVALIPMRDEVIAHLAELDSIEPTDKEPYAADLMEMCLAKFNDVWYRGMVTDIKDDDVREILFVDYGNSEDVSLDAIRRFPNNIKDIPILSITAQFEGIPANSNVQKRIKELIPDEAILQVNVTKANADQMEFTIKVPSVYDVLKEEGLV